MTALVLWLTLAIAGPEQAPARATVDELTRVRELYALASFEEALVRLDLAGSAIEPGPAGQYRALCLLALGRTREAERVVERLVLDVPSFVIPEDEVPPRVAAMFREARERLLPAAARARYTEAREAWDARQLTQAIRGFRDVQTLLADDEFVATVEGLRDLKLLSRDFLALAEAELERERRPVAPAARREPADPPLTPEPAAVTYSEADADVTPPEEVSRRLPYWNPPAALAAQEFRGRLDVVVDEAGEVAVVTLVAPIHPQFDGPLVEAARRWRFRPATRDGVPVRYRKSFEIVLNRR